MITLSAKINLDYDKTVLVQSANIEYGDNHDSLHNIINKVASTPFVGDVPSQRNNLFYDEFDASQKTFWCKADRQTYNPQGVAYYNDILCLSFRVAYFADFSYGLPYADQVVLHKVSLDSKWKDKVYYEYSTTSNTPVGIGVAVDVYIPREFANSGEIAEPTDVFPEVAVYGTASRQKGNVGAVYEITVTTDKPTTSLTLTFDQANNYHPTSVEIDGATFPVRKAVFTTDHLPFGTEHKIRIYNWNSPRTKFFIYGISSHLIDWTDIDYRTLISCDTSLFASSDIKNPTTGIMSNRGSLEFNDTYGVGEYFAEKGILSGGVPVVFYLKNTVTDKSQKIATYYTDEWKYDSASRHFSVSLKDDLEEWQEIEIDGFGFDPRNPKSVLVDLTLANLYDWLCKKTPSKYNMLSFEELDITTQGVLNKTVIAYPFLKSSNLWAAWQKLCVACSMNIFKNADGRTICTYALGV